MERYLVEWHSAEWLWAQCILAEWHITYSHSAFSLEVCYDIKPNGIQKMTVLWLSAEWHSVKWQIAEWLSVEQHLAKCQWGDKHSAQ